MLSISKITSIGRRIPGVLVDTMSCAVPKVTISPKLNNAITWVGEKCSSPENRLILGVTALLTQPFIDGHNTKIDEDTRKVSVARTIAKIIAGTLTGYFVRLGCIKLIDALTKLPTETSSKWRMLFTPDAAKSGILKNLKHYKNAIGTTLSLFIMGFITNFAIDAPLTKYLTNKFTAKIHEHDKLKKEGANE